MTRIVVLTGASGFIGSELAREFLAQGWQVRALARDPQRATLAGDPRLTWSRGELGADLDEAVWLGAELLVHAAWATDTRDPAAAAQQNIQGAERLFAQAENAGVRRLFVSSMSAHPRALSWYGRSKLQIEGMLNPSRDLVVRPGFVLGHGGVHQRLAGLIARLPFIPSFYGGNQPVQTIAVAELCQGIVRAAVKQRSGRLVLASAQAITLDTFYRAIADSLGQPRKPLIHLPGSALASLFGVAEKLHVLLPMTSENLLGLRALESVDTADDLKRVDLAPKDYREVLRELALSPAPSHRAAAPTAQRNP